MLVVLLGGLLYASAHGAREKVVHGVTAGMALRGVDVTEVKRFDASGQRRSETAALALDSRLDFSSGPIVNVR